VTEDSTPSQLTILPAQGRRLAALGQVYNCAIGVSQTGSTLHINTGGHQFDIGPDGNNIHDRGGQTA